MKYEIKRNKRGRNETSFLTSTCSLAKLKFSNNPHFEKDIWGRSFIFPRRVTLVVCGRPGGVAVREEGGGGKSQTSAAVIYSPLGSAEVTVEYKSWAKTLNGKEQRAEF